MASMSAVMALMGTQARETSPTSNPRTQVPPTIIGGGSGPQNVQGYTVYRDMRPIPADELAYQASLGMQVIARHRAGRYWIQNPNFTAGGPGLTSRLPGRPNGGGLPGAGPFSPGQLARAHRGIQPVTVLPSATTVYYTASRQVGYQGG